MKICSIDGCNSKAYGETRFCRKHYMQKWKHGRILERTRYDPNKIILHEDYAEIELYNRKNEPIAYAKIDLEDVRKVKDIKWSVDSNGYVKNSWKNMSLSRLILNMPEWKNHFNLEVDHRNRNTLDNRKSNLRKVNKAQNNFNKIESKNNISGMRGVFYRKREKLWYATIKIQNKDITLGSLKEKNNMIVLRGKCNTIMEQLINEKQGGVITNEDFISRFG